MYKENIPCRNCVTLPICIIKVKRVYDEYIINRNNYMTNSFSYTHSITEVRDKSDKEFYREMSVLKLVFHCRIFKNYLYDGYNKTKMNKKFRDQSIYFYFDEYIVV